MSGLENIIKKIADDAKEKADEIIKTAEESAESKKQEIIEAAEKEAARITALAETEAERIKERITTGITLEIRNKKLAAKQETINKVFDKSLEVLNEMEIADFEKFMVGYLKVAEIKETDEIILPDRYKSIDIKKINQNLSPYKGDRKIDGGFVLVSGGIERNNTFVALIDFCRSELEPLVIEKLF